MKKHPFPLQCPAPRSATSDTSGLTRRSVLGLAGAASALAMTPALAQSYPSRPIRFIVPYAPGGGTDLMMRSLQEPLARALGQPVIIENKSGAAGAIGAREVARANPDGYTFLVSNNGPSVIVPLLQKDAGYDPIRDFSPVTIIGLAPIVLISNPAVPAADVTQFITWARQQAAGVAYASAGVGSIGHLAAELFAKMANIKLVHIPYRGQAPSIGAVLAGETPIAFTSASDALLAHMNAGKIRLLGVGSEQPSPLIPGGVPIAKALPGYKADFWQGILAPAKTPEAIVTRLSEEISRALGTPEMQKKFASLTYTPASNTPAQFSRMVSLEVDNWKALILERGIHAEN
ncbi:MAG: tripartite tricarboxylate transporter substrate binding protein [Sulfuricaulis sp.]|nr:tripartite tricarboxylate transporter substrate binding protein [Sulfuricaulis sp.]